MLYSEMRHPHFAYSRQLYMERHRSRITGAGERRDIFSHSRCSACAHTPMEQMMPFRNSSPVAVRAFATALAIASVLVATQCSERTPPSPPASPSRTSQAPPPPADATPAPANRNRSLPPQLSFHDAAQKAIPSVVNIFTSKRLRKNRPALPEGGPLGRFFGRPREQPQSAISLGSGG